MRNPDPGSGVIHENTKDFERKHGGGVHAGTRPNARLGLFFLDNPRSGLGTREPQKGSAVCFSCGAASLFVFLVAASLIW